MNNPTIYIIINKITMDKKKISSILVVLMLFVFLTGCDIPMISNNSNTSVSKEKVSQDAKVDLKEDGLVYDDYRLDVDNHEYEGGPIEKGAELTLHTYGVAGYEELDGLVYPYLEHRVLDSNGEVVFEESDLIPEDIDGIDADTASETYTYLDIDSSYESGQMYRWITTYSDRQGDAKMDAIVDFVVE